MLTLASKWDDMCEDTMKAMFKSHSEVFMQSDPRKIILNKKGKLSLSVKRLREKVICRHIHAAIATPISWGLLENSNYVFRHNFPKVK